MELGWDRPAFLAFLALPLVLLALLALPRAAVPLATGTLRLWREAAGANPRGAVRRIALPPWALAGIAALACGALALAGPRLGGPRVRTWTIAVDRSPSMGLEWRPSGAEAPRSRLDEALARAGRWLAVHAAAEDRLRWLAAEREAWQGTVGAQPPDAWLAPARYEGEGLEWSALDLPGHVLVTDRGEGLAPERAGVFASGGAAVPGPIGAALVWDGERVRPQAAASPPPLVSIAGDSVPLALADLFRIWADERGLRLVFVPFQERYENESLVLIGPAQPGSTAVRAGRDGWTAGWLASGDPAPEKRHRDGWLVASEPPRTLIDAAPGEVRVFASSMEAIEGDPAAVAVSFAELFDRCLLPEVGAVSIRERGDAGPPVEIAPREAPPAASDVELPPWSPRGPALDAYLALAAALFAAAAAWSRR